MIYAIIIIGLVLDYFTKIWAVDTLKGKADITVIEGFFDFSYLENRGAAFGIFQGRAYLLAAVTLVIMGVLLFNYYKAKKKTWLLTASTGLILTGAVGNLIDRVRFGFVVDFISWHWKDVYYFPSFNVADICITIGTGLLVIYILKEVD
ncbi:signal peptidase II [Proteiniclasticum sp. SCR006]|uniref:Lipoprotein signal peptidase n=1 Tax=Proteiniclasticum aestuarii TaxID=2817862 RepID=A0A939H9A6_9CLOT|nr:signal peptidase II [Proteiniclasticum aestuarii]MBO1263752.1 signal peptidase II [Proteiniclasticum aestuarii]